VRPTETILARTAESYGPRAAAGADLLAVYTEEQLGLITDFMRRSRELQEAHLDRLRAAPPR
jgi:hypothetical protein